jgi:hypothetical protein
VQLETLRNAQALMMEVRGICQCRPPSATIPPCRYPRVSRGMRTVLSYVGIRGPACVVCVRGGGGHNTHTHHSRC